MSELTHFNAAGEAHMVDIGGKAGTERIAVAEGLITTKPETLSLILSGSHRKGDVLGIARIAGIMASKRTADLIPLCHSMTLTQVGVEFEPLSDLPGVRCVATTKTLGPTGVEMEALMVVQVALLTIYDMCKAIDRGMLMQGIGLLKKSGGASGEWRRGDHPAFAPRP